MTSSDSKKIVLHVQIISFESSTHSPLLLVQWCVSTRTCQLALVKYPFYYHILVHLIYQNKCFTLKHYLCKVFAGLLEQIAELFITGRRNLSLVITPHRSFPDSQLSHYACHLFGNMDKLTLPQQLHVLLP